MRQCAVVSVFPFEIQEAKPGIYPGHFVIPPATNGCSVLHVGPSVCYLWVDERQVQLEEPPDKIAKAIVEDYIRGHMDVDESAHPGLFCVDKAVPLEEVKKVCASELIIARQKQTEWFRRIVQTTDKDWKQFRDINVVSDLSRFAAKSLGLERDWIVPSIDAVKQCPACRQMVDSQSVVCMHCRCILDEVKYKQLKFERVA